MVWFSFLKAEDSNLSDSSESGVHDLNKSRKRSFSSSVSLSHRDSLRPKEKQGNGKNVSFNSVTVRNFNLILGDNDGCNVPLSIGWKWVESEPMPLDTYDQMFHQEDPDYVCARRMQPLNLEQRKRRLYSTGYSKQDVRREERRRRIQLAMAYRAAKNGDDCRPIIGANTSIFIERYLLN
jgi:hypothetical protein